MGYVVKMPKLGLEMEQGTVLEWHVKEGDTVTEDEVIVEIESEKSIGEVEAREAGVLRLIGLGEGETVPPGTPIGIVAGGDEDIADLRTEFDTHEESTETVDEDMDEPSSGSAGDKATADEDTRTDSSEVKASPRAERRADELGVDLAGVEGTGPQGAITADDVEDAAETPFEEPTPESIDTTETERVTEASEERYHTTTLVTHDTEASALIETTEMAANAFDFDVSALDVLLLVVSATLNDHPVFNATFEDDIHHLHEHQAIALVDDTEEERIESMISAIDEQTFADLVEASRAQTEPVDGERATFALANRKDSDDVRSIVTPPTVAGLVADWSHRRAIPAENGVRFRRYLTLSLAYDSRAVGDGDAEAFLETLLERIEELPELVLRSYR